MRHSFSNLQKKELKAGYHHGLQKKEIQMYAKWYFSPMQMREIRLGFEQGLKRNEIRKYCHFWIPHEQMKIMRKRIKEGDGKSVGLYLPGGFTIGQWFLFLLCIIGFFVAAVSLQRVLEKEELSLKLTTKSAIIACGEAFDPKAYIQSYTQDETTLKLPEAISTRVPGTYLVVYELSRKEEKIERQLRLIVVDQTSPTLQLKEASIPYQEGEAFDCLDYVASATDNIDGDLKEKVYCDGVINTNKPVDYLLYQVSDSSGNESYQLLRIEMEDTSAIE